MSIIGRTKAAVLPVPVWAMPIRSLPIRTDGIAARWIGVGVVIAAVADGAEQFVGKAEIGKGHSGIRINRVEPAGFNRPCGESRGRMRTQALVKECQGMLARTSRNPWDRAA